MGASAELWVVVLAGGEGQRVRAFTRDALGQPAPKQFCCFGSDRSLVRRALDRARRLTAAERIVVVVSDNQRRWWEVELTDHPRRNIVSQAGNRGTGIAILRATLEVSNRDPDAVMLVTPSDYEVLDDGILTAALTRTVDEARAGRRLVLAGMEVDAADPDLGWIVPGPRASGLARSVATFVEKPDREVARRLVADGALASSLMVAGTVRLLLDLYAWLQPGLMDRFAQRPLARALDPLPNLDFSRDLLEHSRSRLGVVAVPPCGWTDLGTPERLDRWRSRDARELAPAG